MQGFPVVVTTFLLLSIAAAKKVRPDEIDTSDVLRPDPNAKFASSAEYNLDLTEGDILGPKKDGSGSDRNAIAYKDKLWPAGIVPYEMEASAKSPENMEVLRQAIKDFNDFTCVKFVERNGEEDFVNIKYEGAGCSAWLGRYGGEQPLFLGEDCWTKGVVIHELMHTIGFAHEQRRGDRDNYIKIHFDLIHKPAHSQFEKLDPKYEDNQGFPYDFSSIMHYGTYAFALDHTKTKKTITTLDPANQNKIGQRAGFSKQDVEEVKKLYKCDGKNSRVGGKNGCLDRDPEYCLNIANSSPSSRTHACKTPDIQVECKKSCRLCDAGDGASTNSGSNVSGCTDEQPDFCNSVGLQNGPNRYCKSPPHAAKCKKSCKMC